MKIPIVILMFSGIIFSQSNTLKGVHNFSVNVSILGDGFGQLQNDMQIESELLLRSYGLKIQPIDNNNEQPKLRITFLTRKIEGEGIKPFYSYYLITEFYRNVKIIGIELSQSASIWQSYFYLGNQNVGDFEGIVELMKGQIKSFINDYLYANQ